MSIEVKKIDTELEYQQILIIRKKVFIEEQGVPASLEIDENESDAIYFLAKIENQAVSTGRIRSINNTVKFERIATLPEFRGQGIATKLMNCMQSYAKENYPNSILIMYAQESAVTFYKKMGWKEEGDTFLEADIIHQKMTFS